MKIQEQPTVEESATSTSANATKITLLRPLLAGRMPGYSLSGVRISAFWTFSGRRLRILPLAGSIQPSAARIR